MPHYADGTEAKVRDVIKGKPYNTPHEVQGILLGVTPGMDTCNIRVAFLKPMEPEDVGSIVALALADSYSRDRVEAQIALDYGEAKAFTLVHRPK